MDRTYNLHESWLTATREQLLNALEFQGAMTKTLDENNTRLILEARDTYNKAFREGFQAGFQAGMREGKPQ